MTAVDLAKRLVDKTLDDESDCFSATGVFVDGGRNRRGAEEFWWHVSRFAVKTWPGAIH